MKQQSNSRWTLFWDMHSGGGTKEGGWEKIYIEAPEEEARVIFYNRFGHNPDRVSCTCCGPDYAISENESLEQVSAYHRNCKWVSDKRMKGGGYYVEEETDRSYRERGYMTVSEYLKSKEVHAIFAKDIKDEERRGVVPEQGYVWRD